MAKDKVFMQYICKTCGKMFLAEDLYRRRTPETFRSCEECESNGALVIREDINQRRIENDNTTHNKICRVRL